MSKTTAKTAYRCIDCGAESPKWTGWCPACNVSGSLEEYRPAPRSSPTRPTVRSTPAVPIAEAVASGVDPVPTTMGEVDRVLGGGLVPGGVTLVGGEPGVGKSTLLLQLAAAMARAGTRCLYVTAEESSQQVAARAERLDVLANGLWLAAETSLPQVFGLIDDVRPDLLLVDSIQTIADPSVGSGAPGSLVQVRGCAQLLVTEAKRRGLSVVVVGHVTKEGGLAGPKVLEHVVDTVMSFEGERHHALRLLRATKHRFGGTHELGLFEMTEHGLVGVPDASALFLADRQPGNSGSTVAPILDGHRPLLVEVQALVSPSQLDFPKRTVQGIDSGRLSQVLAVLESRAGLKVSKMEVHVAVAGGVKVREPGADLAVALAVASAYCNRAVSPDLVACGEIGLGGEIRQVQRTDRRLAEATRLGFVTALVPRSAPDPPAGLQPRRMSTVIKALCSADLLPRL